MGVRNRQREPDIALVVVIDKSGSMDACHCNTFDGGMGGGGAAPGRPQGRHRQGGDPARRGGADGPRRVRRRRVRRDGALGHPDEAAGRDRRRRRASSGASSPLGQTNIFVGARAGGRTRSRTPSATRRHIILLTDGWSSSGEYDDDHRADEGGRDHPLDRRRRRRLEPVPRAARQERRRPVLRRGERRLDPGHLPQGDAAGRRPADHRGVVLPDPDQLARRSCAASRRASRSSSATTARRSSRRRSSCSSRRATTRSSPSGSTASAGPSRGRPTRPGGGPRTGSAGQGFSQFFTQLVELDVPGRGDRRHRGDVRDGRRPDAAARRERRGGRLAARLLQHAGVDHRARLQHRAGPARPGRAGRVRGEPRRDRARARTRSASPRCGRARRRSGGRWGSWSRSRPSTGCSA